VLFRSPSLASRGVRDFGPPLSQIDGKDQPEQAAARANAENRSAPPCGFTRILAATEAASFSVLSS